LLLVLLALAAAPSAAASGDSVQYTALADAYYEGRVLVASTGSLVAPTAKLARAAARRGGGRAAFPPFQSAEECRQACAALAGCNAFRFCARAGEGCAAAGAGAADDCARWWSEQQRLALPPPFQQAPPSAFKATAAGLLLQLPVRALGPFGGDAWKCVGGGGGGAGAPAPSRWPFGTCTLLRVDDPRKPPVTSSSSSSSGWRSGTVVLPDACLEKSTGQPVPPSADACRACLSAAAVDGRRGPGPSPDICASCSASALATGEDRVSVSGSGGGDPVVEGRRAPVYAAMAGAAAAAARGKAAATVLLGRQPACVSSCAAAGSGADRDAAWKCPGCVLSRSPCAKCFSDRAHDAALSAAFGGAPPQSAASAAAAPARYDAGACVSCVQDAEEVGGGGGTGRADLLFGGCVACAASGGTNRCARCLASASAAASGQQPWWWPAARRSRDRTPCDVCDASAAPGDDAAFDACVACFRDGAYRGGQDCLRCALLQDSKSSLRCYSCVARARFNDPRQRGCSDCMDYFVGGKERERCLACVEDAGVVGAAKAACALCVSDVVIDPGKAGASDARRAAVGDRGQCLACLNRARGSLPATATLDDWRARCVTPAG